jgi:hypothetical protein
VLLAFTKALPAEVKPLPVSEFVDDAYLADWDALVCHLYPGVDFLSDDLLYVEAVLRQLYEVTRAGLLQRPLDAIDAYTEPRVELDQEAERVVRFVVFNRAGADPSLLHTLAVTFAGLNQMLGRETFARLAHQVPNW